MFKFNFISSKEKKVVILDTLTSTYAEYCIPKNINYYIIGFRNEINVILSLKFFLLFCYFFFKTKKLIISSILSICRIKGTKVILTNVDNSQFIAKINDYDVNLKVIMIQNGFRSIYNWHGWNGIEKFPILYGFGKYEEELLKLMKKPVSEYISAGSLKLGIYRKKFFSKQNKNKVKKNISYISQYREGLENKKYQVWLNHKIKILPYLEKLDPNFKIILNFKKNTSSEKKEINFYKKIKFVNKKDIFLVKEQNDFSSYIHSDNSKILISYFSTLAIEFYGIGSKVLFLAGIPDIKTVSNDFMGFLKVVPEFLKISSNDLDEVQHKLNYLKSLPQSEYLDLTISSRTFLMNSEKGFVHELVKKKILKILDNQNR
jgi:surface carbohydrate biosynthesis protein